MGNAGFGLMAVINISIEVEDIPEPAVDDEQISRWIEARLNRARNLFIQRVSRGGGTGRSYRRGRQSVHRASAPGEFPATDSGRLVNSVWYQMLGPREGMLYSDLEYAAYLTTGTRNMEARKM